jgi:hypothetical protein
MVHHDCVLLDWKTPIKKEMKKKFLWGGGRIKIFQTNVPYNKLQYFVNYNASIILESVMRQVTFRKGNEEMNQELRCGKNGLV